MLECFACGELRIRASAALHQMLVDTYAGLQRSGVLRQLGIDNTFDKFAQREKAWRAADEAQHANAVLRTCALGACDAREVHEAQLKKCAACHEGVV
jgi:hypothetical protein